MLAQQAIPSQFFGLHVNQPNRNGDSFPVQVHYGNVRNWNVYKASWPDIQSAPCGTNNCLLNFNFGWVDRLLSNVYQDNGTNSVAEFTLGRTPGWAQPSNFNPLTTELVPQVRAPPHILVPTTLRRPGANLGAEHRGAKRMSLCLPG